MSFVPPERSKNEFVGVVIDDRYELVEEIGRGAMGLVYRARQLRVNRDVAIKLVRTDLVRDEKRSARFEREAQAVAKLEHPNCLTLHDFGYDENLGSLFMVTELLRGQTLANAVDSLTDLSLLQIGYYIADALKHAHEAGVVHRDLKPENIMLHFDDDGRLRLKVVDFGLALLFEQPDEDHDLDDDRKRPRRLTQLGEICGSPRYLSPEQCCGDLSITSAADMYAFGVVLYELYEGEVPFPGPSVPDMLLAHMQQQPPTMESFPLVDVEQLIYDLLRKPPDERPTAQEAREIFGRHVDLTRSGVFDDTLYRGLAESTFGSDAFEEELSEASEPNALFESTSELVDLSEPGDASGASENLPPSPNSQVADPGTLELLRRSKEARIGMAVGVFTTLALLITIAVVYILTQ